MELEGSVALVTGATRGIGATVARRLAGEGAAVVLTGRNAEAGARTAAGIAADGGESTFIQMDVGIEDEVEAAVAATESRYGALHILVNNAAPIDLLETERPIGEMSGRAWEDIVRTGLFGVVWATKFAVRAMSRAGRGSIINISSNAAAQGMPSLPAYTATKGAMNALTRQVAVDYAAAGIRCNALSLGHVAGPSAAAVMATPVAWQAIKDAHLTRTGNADDIAEAVVFLASRRSEFITATIIYVDGGMAGRSTMPNVAELMSEEVAKREAQSAEMLGDGRGSPTAVTTQGQAGR